MLKPIDLTVLAWLVVGLPEWTQVSVAAALGVSQSNVHRALRQLVRSELVSEALQPRTRALRELLVHGARHVYPAQLGPPARGVPTAHSAPMLQGIVRSDSPLVWPCDRGSALGTSVSPLHDRVPLVALEHPAFHEIMALIDVLRVGRVREVTEAARRLDALLGLVT